MNDDENDNREKYRQTLNKQLFIKSKEKFIEYLSCIGDDDLLSFYFSNLTYTNNPKYKTKFTFNYYILISSQSYKKFKQINPEIDGNSHDYNVDIKYSFNNTLNELAKIIKPHYNKKTVTVDAITVGVF